MIFCQSNLKKYYFIRKWIGNSIQQTLDYLRNMTCVDPDVVLRIGLYNVKKTNTNNLPCIEIHNHNAALFFLIDSPIAYCQLLPEVPDNKRSRLWKLTLSSYSRNEENHEKITEAQTCSSSKVMKSCTR